MDSQKEMSYNTLYLMSQRTSIVHYLRGSRPNDGGSLSNPQTGAGAKSETRWAVTTLTGSAFFV